ncbi:hypothetical protein ACLI1A_04350, partial [Flavobacterium sp. RHBU_3]|uniref:hypothetical protein n=1 Tax=Flavobacterium sp. RHBU_3 TaxID=3391184 RepID=UPI003984F178
LYKRVKIITTYRKIDNMIVLKNIACKNDSCVFPPTIFIPIQNSRNCNFLNSENRESKTIFDGRTYLSNFDKYGQVPNIDVDTLYMYDNKLLFYKKIEGGNLGFIFE